MVKRTEAVNEKLGKEDPIGIGDIGNKGPVEQVTENDFEMNVFMEDVLTIEANVDPKDGSLEVFPLNCNGTNNPIYRGRRQKIKRKYVEVLARCRETTYDQEVHDPSQPANIQMKPKTVLSCPFVVLHDPHPHGREWLKAILAQP